MLQQELDKTLETLGRERTELEVQLREQQTETEALRAQREEERAQADSALYQVSGLAYTSLGVYLARRVPLTFPFPRAGLRWLPEECSSRPAACEETTMLLTASRQYVTLPEGEPD